MCAGVWSPTIELLPEAALEPAPDPLAAPVPVEEAVGDGVMLLEALAVS